MLNNLIKYEFIHNNKKIKKNKKKTKFYVLIVIFIYELLHDLHLYLYSILMKQLYLTM